MAGQLGWTILSWLDLRVLLVEDDPMIGRSLDRALTGAGMAVPAPGTSRVSRHRSPASIAPGPISPREASVLRPASFLPACPPLAAAGRLRLQELEGLHVDQALRLADDVRLPKGFEELLGPVEVAHP